MERAGKLVTLVPAVTALLLGTLAIIVVGPHRSDFSDSGDYLEAARMLLNSWSYPETGSLPFFRPPMYPFFISATWLVVPESILSIKAAQVVLHAGTAFLVGKIAVLIFEKRVVGLVAGLIFAAHPLFLFNAAAIQTEALHTFLVTIALWLFLKGIGSGGMTYGASAAAGAALGAAALCKPSALGVGAILIAAAYILTRRENGTLKATILAVIAMFVVILPWTAFNLRTRGELILINDAGGFNLWLGNHPATLKMYEGGFSNPDEARIYADHLGKGLAGEQMAEWESVGGYSALSLKQRERLWSAKALETMQAEPGITVKLFLWKFYAFWKPYLSADVYSLRTALVSAAIQVPLFLFGIWGMFAVWRNGTRRRYVIFFGVLAAAATAIHVLIVSSMRLRMPYIDPILMVFAAGAIVPLAVRVNAVRSIAEKVNGEQITAESTHCGAG